MVDADKELQRIEQGESLFDNYPVEHDFPIIGHRRMLLNARRMFDELGGEKILLAIEDVTGQSWADKLSSMERQKEGKKNGR